MIADHITMQGRQYASWILLAGAVAIILTLGDKAHKADVQTRTQQERVRLYMLSDPVAKIACDGSHRIVLANLAAEKMFGYAPNELTGKPVDVLIPPESIAAHNRAINAATQRLLKMPGDWVIRQSIDTEAVRRDGTRLSTIMDIRSIKYGKPPKVEFIASLVDVDADELPAREMKQLPKSALSNP